MKKLTILIVTAFIAIGAYAQVNRFDKPTEYDFTMEHYIPENYRNHSGCIEARKIVNRAIKNMDDLAQIFHMNKELMDLLIEQGQYKKLIFYNSGWIKEAHWFNSNIATYPYIEIVLNSGKSYYFPNVPVQVFTQWGNAKSAGDYYHSEIEKYSIWNDIPDLCK